MNESPHRMTRCSNHWKHWLLNFNIFIKSQFIYLSGLLLFFTLMDVTIEIFAHIINILQAMFDDLLDELQSTMKEARTTSHTLNRQLQQSRMQFSHEEHNNFHDPTHSLGKAVSFPKAQRFKSLQKEEAKTTDCSYQLLQNLQNQKRKGITFFKDQRFKKQKDDELTIINPNYNLTKKNTSQAPVIKAKMSDLGKSQVSQITAASESQMGPGKYFLNESQVINKKIASFSKSKRFAQEKKEYEDTPLFPNDMLTKKRPPTATVMKQKIEKNKKQISKQQQNQLRERLKFVYWQSIPLELDRLLKSHKGGPLLKQKYFNLTNLKGRQRNCALMHLLNRLNEERNGFDLNIRKELKGSCGVVYRKSTPKPFKFSEMEPGPDYYYPQDDLVKPNHGGFTFGKEKQQQQKPDYRDYQINDDAMKKGGNIVINPEHKPHILTQEQIRSLNRGPGYYDCLFSQVQKRDDIGVVKFQQITSQNARQNNCVEVKQVNDGLYFPSYGAIDANIAGPLYKQPANVRPMHMPDKQLFPEHWLFYDGDLNKVRAQIAKNVLIGDGMGFTEYNLYRKRFKAFKDFMEERRKLPEGLLYQVNYDAVDAHVEGFDMNKKPQKTLIQPIVKQQGEVDGDNLLLNPDKQEKHHLPNINFNTMIGREEDEMNADEVKQGDRLILNPKKIQKHVAEVDFKKMVDRPEIKAEKNDDEEACEGDRIVINPVLPEKKIANIDFQKQSNRPEIVKNNDDDEMIQENVINPQKPQKVLGFVQMKRMTGARFVIHSKKKKSEKASTIRPNSIKSKNNIMNQNQQDV